MNKGPHSKRTRTRNNGKRHTNNKNHIFDSNGPEVRVRGTAHQVLEKYLSLARDASSSGDRITAEGYYQYAEHYYRVISAQQDGQTPPRQPRAPGHDRDGMESSPAEETPDAASAQSVEPPAAEPAADVAPQPPLAESLPPPPEASEKPAERPKRGRPRKVVKEAPEPPVETSQEDPGNNDGETTATAA